MAQISQGQWVQVRRIWCFEDKLVIKKISRFVLNCTCTQYMVGITVSLSYIHIHVAYGSNMYKSYSKVIWYNFCVFHSAGQPAGLEGVKKN